MIALERLNALSQPEFVRALDGIFEHTAWVAERAHASAPFRSRLQLLDALRTTVYEATLAEQTNLILAHPRLGSRVQQRGDLTPASAREQRRAGLAACSDAEYAVLRRLNDAYVERYGLPFILAVRGLDPRAIIADIEIRLYSEIPHERSAALHQIGLIASYRLAERVSSAAEIEFVAMCERLARCPVQPPEADGVRVELLREWLLAAGFEVSRGAGGALRATLGPGPPVARAVLVGPPGDFPGGDFPGGDSPGGDSPGGDSPGGTVAPDAPRYTEALGFLAAIALAQQFRGDGPSPGTKLELHIPRRDLNLLTPGYSDPVLLERAVPAFREFLSVNDHG
jgi:2-oxo-4-hydroxy-4-carboxy-5-ureidoimidazoline decarboxylase